MCGTPSSALSAHLGAGLGSCPESPGGLGVALGIGKGPRVAAGRGRLEQRLEPRRELARRRWAVLPCLSCLLCQLRGLRGTLCKLLLGVLDQSWLPGCTAQAVTRALHSQGPCAWFDALLSPS